MGFVFQSYHLLPELTALENVILPAMIKENSGKTSTIEFAGLKLLEQLGLSPAPRTGPISFQAVSSSGWLSRAR